MGAIRPSLLLLMTMALTAFGSANDVRPLNSHTSTTHQPLYFPSSCTTERPLYARRNGRPILLDTNSLLRGATHCEPPEMPSLSRQLGIGGYVSVDVLVNDKGNVSCVQTVRGHAMLVSSAIDASKKWTFVPKRQKGKEVWFYGQIRFQFLAGQTKLNSCLVAR